MIGRRKTGGKQTDSALKANISPFMDETSLSLSKKNYKLFTSTILQDAVQARVARPSTPASITNVGIRAGRVRSRAAQTPSAAWPTTSRCARARPASAAIPALLAVIR